MGNAQRDVDRVYILLLNWNGWKDTIECLESVFRSDYQNYRVIVCDNDSRDGSIEHIKSWADSLLNAIPSFNPTLGDLITPPVSKPIDYAVYDRSVAEGGGNLKCDTPLVLIKTGANLGFAGGNNVGLRYALARNDAQYVWLLNNDTTVLSDTLSKMLNRVHKSPQIGICGSTVRYYHHPLITQCLGGCTYNRWFGLANNVGYLQSVSELIDGDSVEAKMDYVLGASMLVSSEFLKAVGLMNENYFLYYEEIDWAVRGKGKFILGYAPESIVYHKEGASIGSKLSRSHELRYRSEYFLVKNRINFTKKFYPYAVYSVYIGLLVTLIVRLLRGQWARFVMLVKVLLSKEILNVE